MSPTPINRPVSAQRLSTALKRNMARRKGVVSRPSLVVREEQSDIAKQSFDQERPAAPYAISGGDDIP